MQPERAAASDPAAADLTPEEGVATSSCELEPEGAPLVESRVIRYDGAGWDGVRARPYKAEAELFRGVTRRLLAAPEGAGFELRYFEIEPGGHSTHERHEHVHVAVCLRGCGRVRMAEGTHDVGFGDVVYVAPGEPHQFLNPYPDEPFGFLCVVDRQRDRPVPAAG
ncbi:MAG: cupin domain-containing protein [Gemmatimonadetes bacterium]|nr:cupin domain-containing protein [Gemmatimonadota bacterium]